MTLKDLIKQGEHQQLDFKFRIDDTKKIARTLAAFANTDGGKLLIGVKDNGKISGVDPSEEIHMIEAAAAMHCKPEVTFHSKIWQEDMKLVLEIDVPKQHEKKVLSKDEDGKWKIYIRKGDHTLLANKILLNVWKHEKSNRERPEKIGEEETHLLEIIQSHEPLTLSKMYRLSTLKKSTVDHLLVMFICWKLVKMEFDENGVFYSTRLPE